MYVFLKFECKINEISLIYQFYLLNLHIIFNKMAQKFNYLVIFTLISVFCNVANAQNEVPRIVPTASYINSEGVEEDTPPADAPGLITAIFRANPEYDSSDWDAKFEWRFTHEGDTVPYLIRYEEETQYTFTEYGQTSIVCFATFTNRDNGDIIRYDDTEFWGADLEMPPFVVSVPQSSLKMPNAFSPNGDGINDIYKPKTGFKSIVEFHAIIFNRWGQKLFEWDDPSTGWDGTYNGTPVKDGVYYCLVKARGADGIKYSFKRDVNLLRGFSERTTNSTDN